MELRTTEGRINDLLQAYEGIRSSSFLSPESKSLPEIPEEWKGSSITKEGETEASVIDSLQSTLQSLQELEPKVDKFRKRLYEIDPVQETPRYGPKSQARVKLLAQKYDFLCLRYNVSFPDFQKRKRAMLQNYQREQLALREKRQEERRRDFAKEQERLKKEEGDASELPSNASVPIHTNLHPDGSIIVPSDNNHLPSDEFLCEEASPSSLLFQQLQEKYDREQDALHQAKAREENARLEQEQERKRKLAEEEAQEKARLAQLAAQQAANEEAERQALHLQAEEARLRRRAQELAQKEAERKWLENIRKGVDGVQYYMGLLLKKTYAENGTMNPVDPDRLVALRSLCTLFDQIRKHPEEINHRKIKQSNPHFHRDIGRHEGGIELLIAAGFRPTLLPVANDPSHDGNNDDDQPPNIEFLIQKEPNLETDMDAWSSWYDLNKATLEILQSELETIQRTTKRR